MKKRFWKKFIHRIASCVMGIVTLLSTSACSLADVFAWMSDNGMSSPIDITSNVHKTYFNGGDGSKGDPYQIDNALQLYYFAWLQDLGLFNVDSKDEGTEIDTVYFVLTSNIDMKDGETQYTLPPIGTTEYPFVGNFDGQGYTISNLTVENERDHLFEPPVGSDNLEQYAEIIGFFGVVGSLPQDNLPDEEKYTYNTSANEIKNLLIENITIATHTEKALAGFVAGYANGAIDCVGVVGGTIKMVNTPNSTTYTTNISDYTLIGYCTPDCKNEIYVLGASLDKPGSTQTYTVVLNNSNDGEGQGWGGSVKMADIYTWLTAIRNKTNITNRNYIRERTDVKYLSGKTVTTARTTASRKAFTVDNFGSFVFEANSYVNYVNFVGGGQKVTEYAYGYSEKETVAVYYIKDKDYYLNFYGDEITSDVEGANTKWYASEGTNGGSLYTVIDNTIYYLTMENGTIDVIADVDTDRNNLPEWDFSNGKLSFDGTPIECNNGTWQVAETNTFLISNGSNNYLSAELESNGDVSITNQTNSNSATKWTVTTSGNSRTISTVIDEEPYYLDVNNGALSLSTSQTTWTYNSGRFYITKGNTSYYIRYNSGWTVATKRNQGTTLTLTEVLDTSVEFENAGTSARITLETREYIDTSIENGYYDNDGVKKPTGTGDATAGITYFPLSTTVTTTNDVTSYQINKNNTGYVVGAEWDTTTYDTQDNSASNLRISSYTYNNNAQNPNTPTFSDAANPYTISYKTKGDDGKYQFVQTFDPDDIPEMDNENNVNFSDAHLKKIAGFGLQKFTGCYGNYLGSVSDNSWEGLHFMDAPISTDNLTTITATLSSSKEPIENYQVPTNSIDFNLYDKGFINVVAGSYYTQGDGNNSFFSIYKIERYEDGKTIKSIKEISKVYAKMNGGEIDTSEDYHYTYVGENSTIPADYEMVFDCHWITHSSEYGGWDTCRAYYFEVPVNKGEYAIGSTEGRTGAYLVYLDLAANAQLLERSQDQETIVENRAETSIPNGVEILSKLEAGSFDPTSEPKPVDPFDSAFVSVNTGSTGSVTVEKTDDTIKVTTDSGGNVTAEYISVNTVLTDKGGGVMSVPITQTTTIERTTYRDKNKTTGDLTVTVLTKTTVVTKLADGTTSKTEITYTKEVTVTDKNGNPVGKPSFETITDPEKFVPDTITPDGMETASSGEKFIDIAFAYGQKVDLKISYLYVPATETKDADGNVTTTPATYLITIINPGEDDVSIKAILTKAGANSGMNFIIADGTNETVLDATQDSQKVTIKGTKSTNEPTA